MQKVVILDRDGVLNSMVVHPEHGTIDSPMNESEVVVYPWVKECLQALHRAGYLLFIATNQPAAAKGKTTLANLNAVHARIVQEACGGEKLVEESFIAFAKDNSDPDRKPNPGMMLKALSRVDDVDMGNSWMVGDGVTDVQAGEAAKLKTAFLAPKKCYNCEVFEGKGLNPTFQGKDLRDFVRHVLGS